MNQLPVLPPNIGGATLAKAFALAFVDSLNISFLFIIFNQASIPNPAADLTNICSLVKRKFFTSLQALVELEPGSLIGCQVEQMK